MMLFQFLSSLFLLCSFFDLAQISLEPLLLFDAKDFMVWANNERVAGFYTGNPTQAKMWPPWISSKTMPVSVPYSERFTSAIVRLGLSLFNPTEGMTKRERRLQSLDDPSLDQITSWGSVDTNFVVRDPVESARIVLPRNFKHNNLSSFVRQLDNHGWIERLATEGIFVLLSSFCSSAIFSSVILWLLFTSGPSSMVVLGFDSRRNIPDSASCPSSNSLVYL
ncbi:hypothetical protein K1719_015439 [Acacia pycnantha]|nr:hypothetical protein K1719_015439 [Acacia pycnantha]